MIKVQVKRSDTDDRFITAYRVSGHAQFDEPGKDIVCSAVSAVTVGTVNAIEALTGVVPETKVRDGWLDVRIPSTGLASEKAGDIQLLLEGMVVMLESIEESYGKYIRMTHIK